MRLYGAVPVSAEGAAAAPGGDPLGEVTQHGAVLVGVALFARGEEDLQAVVGGEGAGFLVAIDRVQLRHGLHHGEQAQVVAGEEGGRVGDDPNAPHGGELVVDQQALVFE